jgi:hypothetical protein
VLVERCFEAIEQFERSMQNNGLDRGEGWLRIAIFWFVQWFFSLCDNDNRFCFRLFLQLLRLNGAFSSLYTIVQRCRFIVQSMQNHCTALCRACKTTVYDCEDIRLADAESQLFRFSGASLVSGEGKSWLGSFSMLYGALVSFRHTCLKR